MFITQHIKLLTACFLASSLFISPQLYAQNDCNTSTLPLTFSQSDQEKITLKMNLPDSSRELITFSNGDMLITSVDSCGLGLELLYFSQLAFEDVQSRYEKLIWLTQLTGRDLLVNKLKTKKKDIVKNFSFSLVGNGSDELHTFKSSILTVTNNVYPETFSESLSYIWVPPAGIE